MTFGCRLNRAEALDEEARYLSEGWELTDDHAEADRFVVRGCSVTARAERDCQKLIQHLRKKYPTKRVIVQGCIKDKTTAPGAWATVLARRRRDETLAADDDATVPVPTRTARAYLKVQDGCAGKCTFCIVPQFRGASKSVDFTAALDKARRFIDAGYREIVVTGCNLSLYASQGKRLPDLLNALADLGAADADRACRIRLGSVEPTAVAHEVVDVMAARPNVCKFLHLPIQSGSNRILLAMKRPYLLKDVETLVQEASRRMPRLGLGCDLMTGFPGENEMDFLATESLLKRHPFTNAHVFPFSERPGTPAATFPDSIPKPLRSTRAHRLADLALQKQHAAAKRFRGHKVEVIIEDEKKQTGWTSEYFPFRRSSHALVGDPRPRKSLVTFLVTDTRHGVLIG